MAAKRVSDKQARTGDARLEGRNAHEGKPYGNTDYVLPLGPMEIQRMLPHRYPFALIDRVIDCDAQMAVSIKNVSIGDLILQGHFPNAPIFPGVLIIEGVAQTAAVFGHLNELVKTSTCYLTEVTQARFRQQAVPGDVLRYESRMVRQRKFFFWFEAKAYIEARLAATLNFSAYME